MTPLFDDVTSLPVLDVPNPANSDAAKFTELVLVPCPSTEILNNNMHNAHVSEESVFFIAYEYLNYYNT